MAKRTIQATKNYRLFSRSDDNRQTDAPKHKRLRDSMEKYGFLQCFPIVCRRNGDGKLVVKDGQHRLMFAEELNLTVYWVEEEVDFDIAVINTTAKPWVLRDYAEKFAAKNLADYQEGLDFADGHHLPIGTAFALLAGNTSFSNCQPAFIEGIFKVKDRAWADAVAGLYGPLVATGPAMKNARLLEACMAICRVQDFDSKRMIQNAERCRHLLVPYSTRDAYLDLLEKVYNFGRVKLVGLKAAALMAMRERNVIPGNGKKHG